MEGAFRSIEVGVTPATPGGPQDSLHSVSHNGPNSRNDAEYDPKAVFARLFGGFEVPTTDDGASDAEKMAFKKALLPVHKKMESRIGAETIQSIYKDTGFDPSKL